MPKVATAEKTVQGGVAPHLSGHCELAQKADQHPVGADGNSVIVLNRTPEQIHATCKGAVSNGVGTTWVCSCYCHDGALFCHRCGYDHHAGPEGFDPDRRQCRDATECAEKIRVAIEESRRTNPLWQQLEKSKAEGAAERAARNAERARRRAEEEARMTPAADGPDPAPAPAKGRKAKTPQRCHEGCGGMTKGGQFMMGHDMRLKGRLFAIARGEAGADHESEIQATVEILARGWNLAGINPAVLSSAKKDYAELGELAAIERAVERRYS